MRHAPLASNAHPHQPPPAFLAGGGELARLIAAFDWGATSLGPIATWPAHVKVSIALMLRSVVPIVMLWNEDGVMVYNDAYSVFAGLRHPRLLGSKVREGWPEVADFNDNVMKVGLRGETLSYRDQELTLYRNERAEQVWMDLDYSPLVDESGRPVGVMAIVVETTAKVQAQGHIQREQERLAQMFQQAPGFIAMLRGPSHRFELVNPSYMRLVGHRPVTGRTVAQALPEAVGQGFLELLDGVYRSGVAYEAHGARFSVQSAADARPVDRYVDFVYQPVRDAAGEVDGIFVEGVDVTERIEGQLRRERLFELTDRLLDAATVADVAFLASEVVGSTLGVSRVGYGSIDAATDTLHVDRDWCAPGVETRAGATPLRDYGFFMDDLKRNEFVVLRDVRLDERTRGAAAALEGKSARSFVNMPVVEQGRLVAVFFINDAQVRDWSPADLAFIQEAGHRTRMAAERVRNQQALREANELLEAKVEARSRELLQLEDQFRQSQKMEAIGQLTGGIAHDFNNMLHGVALSLELLQRMLQSGKPGDWERYLGMAQGSVRRAAALTQRLLAFSRRQTLDPRPTDVGQLVASLKDLVQGTVGPSVEVSIDIPDDRWLSRVDAPQLESSVVNLCINARDAMQPAGGRLEIVVRNVGLPEAQARVLDLQPGDYVEVCVADTGAGMSAEVQARAFDPFFTTKPKGEGTGLGLSMVYGFVRQSGGQIRVESQLGVGTTMHLYLPRFEGEAQADPLPVRDVTVPGLRGTTVLLVEDDATICQLLREELERTGMTVVVRTDSVGALAALQSSLPIDLLITDVGLPGGLNGRQIADAGRVTRPGLRVLFITGYADAAAAVGGGHLPAGMEVITKPFKVNTLVRKVGSML